ncbi:hypothetical protein [Microvirga massiliensis]|uniref:hypothetical protein n=1 Tax=Microvirga massiliensis TaxID=1033741 RepID=UPI00062B4370|nr:hypothetical protein [Microvirga massiliensis]
MPEPRFTPAELAKCARRELGWRHRVYPRRVSHGGRLDAQTAQREIAMMEAIAEHFERLAAEERRTGDLFGEIEPAQGPGDLPAARSFMD